MGWGPDSRVSARGNHSLRDSESKGFRLLTYLGWFYTRVDKGDGFLYHVPLKGHHEPQESGFGGEEPVPVAARAGPGAQT